MRRKNIDLVYIAGPISADTPEEREANIARAEDLYADLLAAGLGAICVHSTARRLWGTFPEKWALASDFRTLARCDAILLASGWEMSAGTEVEIAYARKLSIPVFERLADLLTVARLAAQDSPESQNTPQPAVG